MIKRKQVKECDCLNGGKGREGKEVNKDFYKETRLLLYERNFQTLKKY